MEKIERIWVRELLENLRRKEQINTDQLNQQTLSVFHFNTIEPRIL